MEPQADEIVDIPENRVKFFGCSGKMLLPSPATVEALIKKIPERQLLTTDLLRKKLTDQFNVQRTCPVTTRKSLQTVAHDASKQTAYWRVINMSGELISHFPGGVEGQNWYEHIEKEQEDAFPISIRLLDHDPSGIYGSDGDAARTG